MRCYYVSCPPSSDRYCATLAEAHDVARQVSKPDWPDVRIEAIDVADDKAGILHILNGDDGFASEPFHTWRLTPRGGLKPCDNGE